MEDQLFWLGLVIAAAGGALVWIYFRWIPQEIRADACVWDRFFGIYCPGCGGTRAMVSFIQGHLLRSLWYHPIVPYTATIFGAFMVTQGFARLTGRRFNKGIKFHNWYLYGAVIIIIVNCILRNVLRAVWNITL